MQTRELRPIGSNLTGKPSKTYREDRICDEPECQTVLSKYNPTFRCCLHQTSWHGTGYAEGTGPKAGHRGGPKLTELDAFG